MRALTESCQPLNRQSEDICIVFAVRACLHLLRNEQLTNPYSKNADSGEGYITVDGNAGDRNNLTLWHSGDTLITKVADKCANTVVVLHTVGPVIMETWVDHPNVHLPLLFLTSGLGR